MPTVRDHYDALGLDQATILALTEAEQLKALKKAYRQQALVTHPDKGGDPEAFKRVSNAYEFLSNSSNRSATDDGEPEQPPSSAEHEDAAAAAAPPPPSNLVFAPGNATLATHETQLVHFDPANSLSHGQRAEDMTPEALAELAQKHAYIAMAISREASLLSKLSAKQLWSIALAHPTFAYAMLADQGKRQYLLNHEYMWFVVDKKTIKTVLMNDYELLVLIITSPTLLDIFFKNQQLTLAMLDGSDLVEIYQHHCAKRGSCPVFDLLLEQDDDLKALFGAVATAQQLIDGQLELKDISNEKLTKLLCVLDKKTLLKLAEKNQLIAVLIVGTNLRMKYYKSVDVSGVSYDFDFEKIVCANPDATKTYFANRASERISSSGFITVCCFDTTFLQHVLTVEPSSNSCSALSSHQPQLNTLPEWQRLSASDLATILRILKDKKSEALIRQNPILRDRLEALAALKRTWTTATIDEASWLQWLEALGVEQPCHSYAAYDLITALTKVFSTRTTVKLEPTAVTNTLSLFEICSSLESRIFYERNIIEMCTLSVEFFSACWQNPRAQASFLITEDNMHRVRREAETYSIKRRIVKLCKTRFIAFATIARHPQHLLNDADIYQLQRYWISTKRNETLNLFRSSPALQEQWQRQHDLNQLANNPIAGQYQATLSGESEQVIQVKAALANLTTELTFQNLPIAESLTAFKKIVIEDDNCFAALVELTTKLALLPASFWYLVLTARPLAWPETWPLIQIKDQLDSLTGQIRSGEDIRNLDLVRATDQHWLGILLASQQSAEARQLICDQFLSEAEFANRLFSQQSVRPIIGLDWEVKQEWLAQLTPVAKLNFLLGALRHYTNETIQQTAIALVAKHHLAEIHTGFSERLNELKVPFYGNDLYLMRASAVRLSEEILGIFNLLQSHMEPTCFHYIFCGYDNYDNSWLLISHTLNTLLNDTAFSEHLLTVPLLQPPGLFTAQRSLAEFLAALSSRARINYITSFAVYDYVTKEQATVYLTYPDAIVAAAQVARSRGHLYYIGSFWEVVLSQASDELINRLYAEPRQLRGLYHFDYDPNLSLFAKWPDRLNPAGCANFLLDIAYHRRGSREGCLLIQRYKTKYLTQLLEQVVTLYGNGTDEAAAKRAVLLFSILLLKGESQYSDWISQTEFEQQVTEDKDALMYCTKRPDYKHEWSDRAIIALGSACVVAAIAAIEFNLTVGSPPLILLWLGLAIVGYGIHVRHQHRQHAEANPVGIITYAQAISSGNLGTFFQASEVDKAASTPATPSPLPTA